MTHKELVDIAVSVHVGVLLGALAAWYKYGDRSEVLSKSLQGTEATLSRLRIIISDELMTGIKGTLSTMPANPELILGPDGKNPVYSERVTNFLESERFREAVRDFVDRRADCVSDYRALTRARTNWCFWARVLSWSILLLIVVQLLSLCVHGFVDKILGKTLPDWTVHGTLR